MNTEFQTFLAETSKRTYEKIYDYFKNDHATSDEHLSTTAMSYFQKPGKALRPALLTLSAMICGGNAEDARCAAAAVEMFHTWTLVHDDIIDHDPIRRGHDTAHIFGAKIGTNILNLNANDSADFGQALAILSGDLLHGFAVDMLLHANAPAEILTNLASEMNRTLNPELLSGEQKDIRMSYLPWKQVSTEMVMDMMRLKTGALLAFSARAGAAIGNGLKLAQNKQASLLGDFAISCGIAFQLQDDVLGIFGDEKIFGKPIGSDIREGKRTIMMLDTLRSISASDKERIMPLLGNKNITDSEVSYVADCVKSSGALARSQALAESLVTEAMSILELFPESDARSLLTEWARLMTKRAL